ncbi:MAG: LysM peptidoglycan-binding domain-containing protein [Chlamydiia bacterium]|nr:LysM peptidoglycan-binding domain-containing protein [Chlamydiia bacterium]
MERRKAILMTATINAALLLILFIASLTTDPENTAEIAVEREVCSPVFVEPVSPILAYQSKESFAPSIPLPQEEPVQHILPPVALSLPPIVQEAVTPPSPPPKQILASAEPILQEVVVQKGDSLEKIAKRHHTSVDALLKCNQLTSTFLKIGQKLKIPPAVNKTVAPSFTPEGAEYYTMKVGDTIFQ